MHILSSSQFQKSDLIKIFKYADYFKNNQNKDFSYLKGKILSCLFYQPSTRTFSSFVAAMQKLGGTVIPIQGVQYSSVAKGESLEDTVKTLECYSDLIALRHYEEGSASLAASICEKPIINAGDGTGEHPTQSLLDLYTILNRHGKIDGLTISMLGDLKHSRTIHSLCKLLSLYDVKINLYSPKELRLPNALKDFLESKELIAEESNGRNLKTPIKDDVLYVTRVQKEYFKDKDTASKYDGLYDLNKQFVDANYKNTLSIMHPFPRMSEIPAEFDKSPKAAYFEQIKNGLFVRMALIMICLKQEHLIEEA